VDIFRVHQISRFVEYIFKDNFIINKHQGIMDISNTGISILIPLYNGIDYLEESVYSIILQTHKKWEIIIGINGHEENSEVEKKAQHIKEKYGDKNIIVKYYTTKGKANTLNEMVKDTFYDFIALLDVDDVWLPTKLEKQTPYLYQYDIVGTRCVYFGEKSISPPIPVGFLNHQHNFLHYNPIINSSAIIKKQDAKWNDIPQLVDYDMWLRLSYEKKTFYNIDEILCKHRIHKTSFFNNTNDNHVDQLKSKWRPFFE